MVKCHQNMMKWVQRRASRLKERRPSHDSVASIDSKPSENSGGSGSLFSQMLSMREEESLLVKVLRPYDVSNDANSPDVTPTAHPPLPMQWCKKDGGKDAGSPSTPKSMEEKQPVQLEDISSVCTKDSTDEQSRQGSKTYGDNVPSCESGNGSSKWYKLECAYQDFLISSGISRYEFEHSTITERVTMRMQFEHSTIT